MNSRSWRNDELGYLISSALHKRVKDAQPSPQAWQNIKRRLAEEEHAIGWHIRWPQVTVPGFQASLTVLFLLLVISTLTWDMAPRNNHSVVKSTAAMTASASAVGITVDDHPSEPSPIVMRAKDMAVRRALATAIDRGVFEGNLKRSSGQSANRRNVTPAQRIGLARARD